MSLPWTPTKSRPNIRQNRLAWNESWENDLDKLYGRGVFLDLWSIFQAPKAAHLKRTDNNDFFDNIRTVKGICDLQQDLAQRMVESLAVHNFEAEWRDLPDARRRELVLEGICRAAVNGGKDMEERRIWCPEITVSGLADQQGAGFITLAKSLLPADVSSPIVEPIHVSHSIVDKVLHDKGTDPSISATIQSFRLGRIYFISTAVWQITLAFHGVEEPAFVAKPVNSVKREISRYAAKKYGPEVAAQMLREYKNEHRGDQHSCWHCKKLAPSGTKFSACSACRQTADRYLRYCSRECQHADWKSHRQICGKVIDLDTPVPKSFQIETTDADELIPAPIPSFRRPPALLHQLTYLTTLPEADYAIIEPSTETHVIARRVLLPPHVPGRREFLVMRRRALSTGSPAAVYWMFKSLTMLVVADKLRLKEQLEAEYGVSLDANDSAFVKVEPVTEEEKAIVERSGKIRADDHDWLL